MSLIYIKRAQPADLPTVMEIINHAKARLKAEGSPQWQDGYPNDDTLRHDIAGLACYLLMVDDQVAGTASMIVGDDLHYQELAGGHWANETDPYATIHRIAIAPGHAGQNLSYYFFSNLISQAYAEGVRNFRIDTHDLNKRVQAIVARVGYTYRGTINVAYAVTNQADAIRRAYELNLK